MAEASGGVRSGRPVARASRRVEILGVPIDDVTTGETLEAVRRFLHQPGLKQIVTVNPEFVMRARSDPAFREVLARADLALPDGIGLVWAGRLLGRRFRERVAGSDLVPLLSEVAAGEGVPVFYLGAAPGVAEEAACRLHQLLPALRVAGAYAGSPDPTFDETQSAVIRDSGAGLLFVAYGAPAQDQWIDRNRERLEVRVAMGVGGAFDFLAGRTVRAPAWMRRLGLEWLHRLLRQPWRWRRLLRVFAFALLVLGERLGRTAR